MHNWLTLYVKLLLYEDVIGNNVDHVATQKILYLKNK